MKDRQNFTAPAKLLQEEEGLVLDSVDEGVCYRLGRNLADGGLEANQPLAVSVRLGEREIFHAGLPGSTALNDTVIEAKWNTARSSGHSSLYERNVRLARGTTFEEETKLQFPEHAAFGGAVPIRVSGHPEARAYVIVSGLSQEEDHALAAAAIRSARAVCARPPGLISAESKPVDLSGSLAKGSSRMSMTNDRNT